MSNKCAAFSVRGTAKIETPRSMLASGRVEERACVCVLCVCVCACACVDLAGDHAVYLMIQFNKHIYIYIYICIYTEGERKTTALRYVLQTYDERIASRALGSLPTLRGI